MNWRNVLHLKGNRIPFTQEGSEQYQVEIETMVLEMEKYTTSRCTFIRVRNQRTLSAKCILKMPFVIVPL